MTLSIPARLLTIVALSSQGASFQLHHLTQVRHSSWRPETTSALHLSAQPSEGDMRRIMEEESMNPATLAESAERMKNMTPEDMTTLIAEMEKMPDAQKEQLKKMGVS